MDEKYILKNYIQIDTNKLINGLYIVQIELDNTSISKKFILNK